MQKLGGLLLRYSKQFLACFNAVAMVFRILLDLTDNITKNYKLSAIATAISYIIAKPCLGLHGIKTYVHQKQTETYQDCSV